jgi:hypothetical protein
MLSAVLPKFSQIVRKSELLSPFPQKFLIRGDQNFQFRNVKGFYYGKNVLLLFEVTVLINPLKLKLI